MPAATPLPLPELPIRPWIGTQYQSGGLLGKRIAIICNLNEQWPLDHDERASLTLATMERQLARRKPALFWSNLGTLLLGKIPEPELREALWQSVALYEYAQLEDRAADALPLSPPRTNAGLFLDTLAALQPAIVLVLGSQLWRSLPSSDAPAPATRPGDMGDIRVYANGAGVETLALYVRRPSSGFNPHAWRPFVEDALRRR